MKKKRKRREYKPVEIGAKYGRWTVLAKAEKKGYFTCRCECGTVRDVFGGDLKNGQSRSCGCLNRRKPRKYKPVEIGAKYGRWTVLAKAEKKGYFTCRCECGTVRDVMGQRLKNGQSRSCGCFKKRKPRKYKPVEIGAKYGRWTVLAKAEKKGYFTCRCDCGTVKDVHGQRLKNGQSRSCGCLMRDLLNERWEKNHVIGRKKGRLTVIRKLYNSDYVGYYLCHCDCGNDLVLPAPCIAPSSNQISCGCLRASDEGRLRATIGQIRNKTVQKNSTTGVTGVTINQGKYVATLRIDGVIHYLGIYDTLEEAKKAREEGEMKYFLPVIEKWEAERKKRDENKVKQRDKEEEEE